MFKNWGQIYHKKLQQKLTKNQNSRTKKIQKKTHESLEAESSKESWKNNARELT